MAIEDDDDSLPPLGENTQKFLDQAKKGQPRSFLLVCKGNKVKYLAVKKKPVKKNELNEAKKSGYKGEGYFGVITGKGMELVFNLSMADGYTAEPVKDKILKDFLEEKADFKCKPTIAIVATLPEIPFDEEDLSHPLIARFIALGEFVSQVLSTRPETEGEIKQSTSNIRVLLQEGEFHVAEQKINDLASRLKELASGAPIGESSVPIAPPSSPSQSPEQANNSDGLKKKLEEAIGKLVPQLKEAVAKFPEKKVELLTPVAAIKKQLEAGDLQVARQGILDVGKLLKSLAFSTGMPNSLPNQTQIDPLSALRDEYDRKLAALRPQFDKAMKESFGDTNKFRTVMSVIVEQVKLGDFAKAILVIDKLSLAVQNAIATSTEKTQEKNAPTTELPELQLQEEDLKQDQESPLELPQRELEPSDLEDQVQQEIELQPSESVESQLDEISGNVVGIGQRILAVRTQWQKAQSEVEEQIVKLEKAISVQLPTIDAKIIGRGVSQGLSSMWSKVDTALMNGSSEGSDESVLQSLVLVVRQALQSFPTDPRLQLLGQAKVEMGIEIDIAGRLLSSLTDIDRSLAG